MKRLIPAAPILCLYLCATVLPSPVAGQEGFELWPGTRYDPAIPTFEKVLGHGPGERIVSHAEIQKYLAALREAAPDRIAVHEYARSWEGRELVYAVVGSRENLARIDDIRAETQRLVDPRSTDAATAAEIIEGLPALAWLAYGVHGNEISSPDAGLFLAYHLLAADGEPVRDEILADAVVIIDPTQNPDGRDRFVHHYRVEAGLEPDDSRWAAEHNERWPGGRTNHYHFDLNRDYFALTQPETRGRVAALQEWYPVVYVDLHEMSGDSTYYFAPSARPVNPHLTRTQKANEDLFGRNNARWFDHYGFDYFTREVYDSFYPGYGDSWPSFLGAVGMTYEQASVRGLVLYRTDGDTFHFRDSVRQHFTASLATAQTVAKNRRQLLTDLYGYHVEAVGEGTAGDPRAFVLRYQGDRAMVDEVARLLAAQGVELRRAGTPVAGCDGPHPAGSYVIDLAQRRKRLLRTLLDRHVPLADDWMQEQERRRAKGLPDQIYDITAFSLPLLFGFEAVPCTELPVVEGTTVSADDPLPAVEAGEAQVAYLVPWGDTGAAKLLTAALREGLHVLSGDLGFEQGGVDYGRGTLVFKTRENPDDLRERLSRLASQTGAEVVATDTGWIESGANFGSESSRPLRPVRIALAWDVPTASYSAGNTRWVLERRFGYPTTPIRTHQLAEADLDRFDVLVLPSGSAYSSVLGSAGAERLRNWVEEGGVIVAVGGALDWLVDDDVGLLSSRRESRADTRDDGDRGVDEETSDEGRLFTSEEEYRQAIAPRSARPDSVPGAIVRAIADPDHWLTAGLDDSVSVLLQGSAIYSPLRLDDGVNALLFAGPDDLVESGYLWDENRRQLAWKPAAMVQNHGRGLVVALAVDPSFRGYAHGLNVLFLNAIFRGAQHSRGTQ